MTGPRSGFHLLVRTGSGSSLPVRVRQNGPVHVLNEHAGGALSPQRYSFTQTKLTSSSVLPDNLNLDGKNLALVGLGSYIVNATAPYNECHGAGPANSQYVTGGNPYMGQPKMINQATYLGGGRDFGPVVPGSPSAHIISRNLTPDKTGLPEGGRSFADFVQIMRTGVDLDNLHPTCPSGVVNTGCIPAPFQGELLQVMPWPDLQNLTDHDLRAIYEYLSAIPCVAGPPAPSPLHNDCF